MSLDAQPLVRIARWKLPRIAWEWLCDRLDLDSQDVQVVNLIVGSDTHEKLLYIMSGKD
jgi:hypothetical protein